MFLLPFMNYEEVCLKVTTSHRGESIKKYVFTNCVMKFHLTFSDDWREHKRTKAIIISGKRYLISWRHGEFAVPAIMCRFIYFSEKFILSTSTRFTFTTSLRWKTNEPQNKNSYVKKLIFLILFANASCEKIMNHVRIFSRS